MKPNQPKGKYFPIAGLIVVRIEGKVEQSSERGSALPYTSV